MAYVNYLFVIQRLHETQGEAHLDKDFKNCNTFETVWGDENVAEMIYQFVPKESLVAAEKC